MSSFLAMEIRNVETNAIHVESADDVELAVTNLRCRLSDPVQKRADTCNRLC